jgi:hypothetical protein
VNPKYRILIPVALAAVAALANFMLLKRATATTSVLVLSREIQAGEPLKESDLTRSEVKADPGVFDSAYPAANQNELVGMRLRRTMKAGELLIKYDVDVDGQNWVLRPGERDADLYMPAADLPHGLTSNVQIEFIVPGETIGKPQILGPYRLLGTSTVPSKLTREPFVRISFAGSDLEAITALKSANPDKFRLGGMIQMRRIGNGTKTELTGLKVANRNAPTGE